MTATLTITAKGQVTLRKEFLAHLGAQPGDRLIVNMLEGGRLQVEPKRGQPAASLSGLLAKSNTKRLSIAEINDAAAAGWAGER